MPFVQPLFVAVVVTAVQQLAFEQRQPPPVVQPLPQQQLVAVLAAFVEEPLAVVVAVGPLARLVAVAADVIVPAVAIVVAEVVPVVTEVARINHTKSF